MALMVCASNPEENLFCNNAQLLPHLNPLIQWLTPGVGSALDSILNENRQNGIFNLNLSGLWWHGYWLPQGNTWKSLPTKYSDMLYPLLAALPILLLRVLFETFVACKLDWAAGIKTSHLPVTPLQTSIASILNSFISLPKSGARRKKVLENMWRFFAYLAIVLYGCFILSDKSWMYDLTECWAGYPNHEVDSTLWWYYIIQTAFYWSLLFSCWFDIKRTDFKQICIHHVVTVSLLSLSWSTNFVRIGSVVLFLHDISDVAIEFAKLLHYSKCRLLVINTAFAAFLISWFATRVLYFPFVLMRSAVFDAPGYIQANYCLWSLAQPFAPRLMILLLFTLLWLHLFWTVLILKVVRNIFVAGAPSDVRSDDEEEKEKLETQSCQPCCQDQMMLRMQASIRQSKSLSGLTGLTEKCCCMNAGYNRTKVLKTRKMLNELRKRG